MIENKKYFRLTKNTISKNVDKKDIRHVKSLVNDNSLIVNAT